MTHDLAMYASLVQENMRLAAELEALTAECDDLRKVISQMRLMQTLVDAKGERERNAAERAQIAKRVAA